MFLLVLGTESRAFGMLDKHHIYNSHEIQNVYIEK